ncbi:MAG: Type 1 glutamine amidotransferase-like domain-containing protein [Candidatus Bathyarchaeota archaeon]|nr:Type 1 glutamine amidotransferase-like domain-containing protein [Candidatus Bathyarchaeota archaeon]
MPTYYLLGGENTHHRSAVDINQAAFLDAGGKPRVLVFAWARASFDSAYQKSKLLFDYFRSLGASSVDFANYSSSRAEIKDQISESDVVYLTGGVPMVLLERLRLSEMAELLKGFSGVVVGRSAGALALCRRCVVTGRDTGRVKIVDGLGLVNMTYKAHYQQRNDEVLQRLSLAEPIFAVPKDSAIICNDNQFSFFNPVYLFEKGQRQQVNGSV